MSPPCLFMPFYTNTSQVRGNALDFVGLTDLSIRRSTSFFSVMTSQLLEDAPSGSPLRTITEIDSISSTNQRSATSQLLKDAPSGSPLRTITEIDNISSTNQHSATSQLLKDAPSGSPLRIVAEIDSISSTKQRSASAETDRQEAHGRRCSSPKWILSPGRHYCEPVGVKCDGWCMCDSIPCATVVSAICAWWDGRQILMKLSRLRPTNSCLYRHAQTRSALGKAHGVRSRPFCAASSVSAPCSNMAFFVLRT